MVEIVNNFKDFVKVIKTLGKEAYNKNNDPTTIYVTFIDKDNNKLMYQFMNFRNEIDFDNDNICYLFPYYQIAGTMERYYLSRKFAEDVIMMHFDRGDICQVSLEDEEYDKIQKIFNDKVQKFYNN